MIIYISHPFGGKEENKLKIAEICKRVAREGNIPLSPVHSLSWLNDHEPKERQLALDLCLQYLFLCDEMWLYGDWQKSAGCQMEVNFCKENEIPYKRGD